MVLLHLIKPVWKDVFFGLVPSKVSLPYLMRDHKLIVKTLVAPGALYVGVGIIGGKLPCLCGADPQRRSCLMLSSSVPH